MIRRIQALNYRCLRYVDVSLDYFHVLVGPNAGGKSTLLDVLSFLHDLIADGLDAAVEERTRNFQDLVWGRPDRNSQFELAVEFEIPETIRARLPATKRFQRFRYEVRIRERDDHSLLIDTERGLLISATEVNGYRNGRFPSTVTAPDTILSHSNRGGTRTVLSKSQEGQSNFRSELSDSVRSALRDISFGPTRSTLGQLPEISKMFPASIYVKQFLTSRIRPVFLDCNKMRQASPPKFGHVELTSDGANLPWAVNNLRNHHRSDYDEWLRHVRTVLSDLNDIRVVMRNDDRHAYLMLEYDTGVRVPSWMTSDGTLRFLALTLLAYLPISDLLYLLEEPENGVHPMALDPVYDSLASVYRSQMLVTTHSPTFLRLANPEDALCFARDEAGATDIIRGDNHPHMRDWAGKADMNFLFATGVIG